MLSVSRIEAYPHLEISSLGVLLRPLEETSHPNLERRMDAYEMHRLYLHDVIVNELRTDASGFYNMLGELQVPVPQHQTVLFLDHTEVSFDATLRNRLHAELAAWGGSGAKIDDTVLNPQLKITFPNDHRRFVDRHALGYEDFINRLADYGVYSKDPSVNHEAVMQMVAEHLPEDYGYRFVFNDNQNGSLARCVRLLEENGVEFVVVMQKELEDSGEVHLIDTVITAGLPRERELFEQLRVNHPDLLPIDERFEDRLAASVAVASCWLASTRMYGQMAMFTA